MSGSEWVKYAHAQTCRDVCTSVTCATCRVYALTCATCRVYALTCATCRVYAQTCATYRVYAQTCATCRAYAQTCATCPVYALTCATCRVYALTCATCRVYALTCASHLPQDNICDNAWCSTIHWDFILYVFFILIFFQRKSICGFNESVIGSLDIVLLILLLLYSNWDQEQHFFCILY